MNLFSRAHQRAQDWPLVVLFGLSIAWVGYAAVIDENSPGSAAVWVPMSFVAAVASIAFAITNSGTWLRIMTSALMVLCVTRAIVFAQAGRVAAPAIWFGIAMLALFVHRNSRRAAL